MEHEVIPGSLEDPEDFVPENESAVDPISNGIGSASVIDEIKAKRRKLGDERILDLEIPGYDGLMWARYHYVDGMYDELRKIIEKADKSRDQRRELYAQIDVLILACKEILIHKPEDPTSDENGLIPIDKEEPTRFNTHLSEILEFPAKRARDVVMGVFRNNLAIASQHNEMMTWAASNQQAIDEETAGKSEGTSQ